MMSKRTITVTGVAGFLGSNLLERLLAKGHTVIGLDNLSMRHVSNIEPFLADDRFQFVQADTTDPTVVDEIHADVGPVVHLAAFKIPRYGEAIDTLRINYHATENVLEFARRHGCKCVLASTSDVYGRNPEVSFRQTPTGSRWWCWASSGPTGRASRFRGGAAAGGVHRRGADSKVIPITRSSGP
jgi:UDP-glucose 4-epimerase